MCYQCHSDTETELAKSLLHQPFGDGNCLDCHEAHSSPVVATALLVKEERLFA